jgi:hypothetical protein
VHLLAYSTDGRQARPYETVHPLAESLGLEVDVSMDRDDIEAAVAAAKSFTGDGNVLICWEHHRLTAIVKALGVKGYSEKCEWTGEIAYPKQRFDLIWVVPPPYDEIALVESEDC